MRTLLPVSVAALLAGCAPDATLYVENAEERAQRFRDDAELGVAVPDVRPDDVRADSERTDGGGRRDSGGDAGERDDVEEEARVPLGPACIDAPSTLEFGIRTAGEVSEEIFRVANCGGFEAENLVIDDLFFVDDGAIQSAPELSLANNPEFPFAILPNEEWPFQVRFRPTTAGTYTGVIRLVSNDPARGEVDISVSASAR